MDDNPTNIRILGEALRSKYEIIFAASGEKALTVVMSKNLPDIVITDINMPHLEKVAKIIANQNKYFDFDQEASTSCDREIDIPFGVQVLRVAKDFYAFGSSGMQPAEALNKICDKGKYYNQFIVDALSSLVSRKPAQKTRSLKIDELSIGMIFVENLTATSGQFICSKGTVIDEILLNRIINFSLVMEIVEPIKVVVPSTTRK